MSRLVVDACVLRGSGGTDAPSSTGCRHALDAIYKRNHRVAITLQILEEWNKHQSIFARRWRGLMESFRRLDAVPEAPMSELRERISQGLPLEANRSQALKDVHLVEAALRSDKSIVSQETLARNLFAMVPGQPKILDGIAWVDPVEHQAEAMAWLESGARATKWPH
jgi:hypothetical protein